MKEKKHPRGLLLNRGEIAHYLGIARTTVDDWVRAGMPIFKPAEGRGKSAQFDSAEVVTWIRANRSTSRFHF